MGVKNIDVDKVMEMNIHILKGKCKVTLKYRIRNKSTIPIKYHRSILKLIHRPKPEIWPSGKILENFVKGVTRKKQS